MPPTRLIRRRTLVLGAGLGLATHVVPAASPDERSARLLVPQAAGTLEDAVARAMHQQLGLALGRSLSVENGCTCGATTHATDCASSADLTLGLMSSDQALLGLSRQDLAESWRDVVPITIIGSVPLVLVAHPALAVRNVGELVTRLKARSVAAEFGSIPDSVQQLATSHFCARAGVSGRQMPHAGNGPLSVALIKGAVKLGFLTVASAAPYIRVGLMRAVGVSTTTRSTLLPGVPTLAEQGLANENLDLWFAAVAAGGLPRGQLMDLYARFMTTLGQRDVQTVLRSMGLTLLGNTPEQADTLLHSELAKYARLRRHPGAGPV